MTSDRPIYLSESDNITLDDVTLFSIINLMEIFGVPQNTIEQWISKSEKYKFPKAIMVGDSPRWFKEDISTWIRCGK
jgi:predicted DNA-binding transcriptional regulator AlpA